MADSANTQHTFIAPLVAMALNDIPVKNVQAPQNETKTSDCHTPAIPTILQKGGEELVKFIWEVLVSFWVVYEASQWNTTYTLSELLERIKKGINTLISQSKYWYLYTVFYNIILIWFYWGVWPAEQTNFLRKQCIDQQQQK